MNLRGSCGMCGKCCEAIHIPVSPERIADMAKSTYAADAKFVHENWVPISRAEAYEINPVIKANADRATDVWKDIPEGKHPYDQMHFYTCKQLDKEKGLCKVHANRPDVCSGYPWYGSRPSVSMLFYSDDCGYIVDVDDEIARLAKEEQDVIQLDKADSLLDNVRKDEVS